MTDEEAFAKFDLWWARPAHWRPTHYHYAFCLADRNPMTVTEAREVLKRWIAARAIPDWCWAPDRAWEKE